MHSVPLPQGNLSPTIVALVAHLADHQSASPTANPPVLLPERNAEEDPDKDPPAPGGGVVDVTKLLNAEQRAANQRLVADNIVRYQKELRALAAREARRLRVDADDTFATATHNMWSYGGKFDDKKAFLPWAATATFHAALEELSKKKRLRQMESRAKPDSEFDFDNLADPRDEAPIDVLVQREAGADAIERTKRRLDQIEACLDGKDLVGFQARRTGLTYLELAANAGENKHTARSWIFRGMRKAREVA